VQVHGPVDFKDCFGLCWQIDGRSKLQWQNAIDDEGGGQQLLKVDSPDAAEPGDQFTVKLETLGKYRVVTWEKIVEEQDGELLAVKAAVPAQKYYVIGSVTGWVPREMTRSSAEPVTVFTCDVTLTMSSGSYVSDDFQIIVDEDMRRCIYPEVPTAMGGPAMGPDELGVGCTWQLQGNAGDTFKIVLEKSVRSGVMVSKVTWERTREYEGTLNNTDRYYVVGSWDGWLKPNEMEVSTHSARSRVLLRSLPEDGVESFMILQGGYSGMLTPSMVDAHPYTHHNVRGPSSQATRVYWTVGLHEKDQNLKGSKYNIVLELSERGRPLKVTWDRLTEVLLPGDDE
jgi:hypothetical protein